jgi:hypothetical protein
LSQPSRRQVGWCPTSPSAPGARQGYLVPKRGCSPTFPALLAVAGHSGIRQAGPDGSRDPLRRRRWDLGFASLSRT